MSHVNISLPLDGQWRFAIDPDSLGEADGWSGAEFDDSEWATVTTPHTWNVDAEDHAGYEGVAWYRRSFTPPEEIENAHLRLRFEAVCYLARVWLNGEYLGQHEGGYTPFEFDVSGIVEPGAGNVIAVRVDNVRAADRIPAFGGWRLYGGIVRPVWLEITGRAFIARQHIVALPHLTGANEADEATITATVRVRNAFARPLEGTLVADVLDEAAGCSVLESPLSTPVRIPAGESSQVRLKTKFPRPDLWHVDHLFLYRWSAALLGADGQTLHTHEVTFGVRSVELKDARFYLNGEPVRLVGLSRHADVPGHGLAETAAVMAADFDDLKRLNMVLGRPVHYPQHSFILDYCDRNGILLIPELPAWQLTAGQMADPHVRELAQQQLREMILADFNHPCVWAWSVGNELESDTAAGREYVRDVVAYVKSIDPTRPVGFASYHLLVGRPWADATQFADFVMMNQYFGTWHGPRQALGLALDTVHLTWPQKPVIVSEFGFCPHWQRIEGPAQIDPDQYYAVAEDASPDSEEADVLRRRVIAEQMPVFRSRPFVVGALFWCYRGKMGVVDAEGNRRGSWRTLRDEYSPVLIERVDFSSARHRRKPSGSASGGHRRATVTLRTRGPIDVDMPAYTLRGYRLHWAVTSAHGSETFAEGDLPLPTLAPGTVWSGDLAWAPPGQAHVLALSIIRPTGFPVLERTWVR